MPRPKWFEAFLFVLVILTFSCAPGESDQATSDETENPKEKSKAQEVVDNAIDYAGGDRYEHSEISFLFRDREYTAYHNRNGKYEYTRAWEDSLGRVKDVLNNDGFYREINGARVDLVDSMAAKYARSVNSVIYFALLPDALNDPAVIKEYMGTKNINGHPYHQVRVTFEQDGGGTDFEDEFIYWFDEVTGQMDYMAYLYYTDGGGMRFREAYNPRRINGIMFYDFINFKPADSVKLENIADAYLNDELEVLSRIEQENIEVTLLE